jgi:hypothetical protein
MLLSFFREQEYEEVQAYAHALDYSAKTEAWADTYHNIDIIAYQMKPVLLSLELISERAFDLLHQQALIEMQQNGFCGIGHVTTMVGRKPGVGTSDCYLNNKSTQQHLMIRTFILPLITERKGKDGKSSGSSNPNDETAALADRTGVESTRSFRLTPFPPAPYTQYMNIHL